MAYRVAITCAIVTVEGILCYRRSKAELKKVKIKNVAVWETRLPFFIAHSINHLWLKNER